MKNKIIFFIITFLLLVAPFKTVAISNSAKENTIKVDTSKKIYDFADLFSDAEEKNLFDKAVTYIKKYDMDIAVVTIKENNKGSAKSYAEDFYDYNDFGENKSKDGLILLIDMDNRELWITTTGYAQLVYDDGRLEKILDDIYYYASIEDYGMSAASFIDTASRFADLGVADSNSNYYVDDNGEMVKKKSANYLISILVAFALSSFTTYIFISRHKGIRAVNEAGNYLNKEKTRIHMPMGHFLTTFTSRVPIVHNSFDSTSSSHGGSSISHGSSGTSHGGGGRHF